MTQYAVILYAPLESDDTRDSSNDMAEHDRYAETLIREGNTLAMFALEDVATATALRGDVMSDGPFLETKEYVAGFYVIEEPDLDAAIAEARRNPILHQGGGVEVRPVEGFGMWPRTN